MEDKIYVGDALTVLKTFPDESFDSCVTDPPYGLKFMGKKWDYAVPSVDVWREVLRVLKPGAHLLSFGGTRTYHRMVVNIEDAGFEIRDQIQWIYGSGFPKSLDVGDGRGTALKPANEPICLARKPFKGTVADNVLKHGTGGLNIDGCRIPTDDNLRCGSGGLLSHMRDGKPYPKEITTQSSTIGRFPANVILDEEVATLLDEQSGELKSGVMKAGTKRTTDGGYHGNFPQCATAKDTIGDFGGASRFFYCAKSSRSERNRGLEGLTEKPLLWSSGTKNPGSFQSSGTKREAKNNHPTVKPLSLMKYLCRLITPPKGIILDPFAGSGTTGIAARDEGFNFILIDKEKNYAEISQARIKNILCQPQIINLTNGGES